ncbi:hypothetical protein [Paramicrobacterium chengjingii]|uniref:hypothetical protein n=1 Tax=Paramicrobacterium chengjingii TaxID=2769067 RepID=UPI00141E07B6|nr:hypothetical protein [Microbacterium chengjingii]
MRIRPVVNLHTANRFTIIGQPLMIMGFSFVVIIIVGIIANSVTSSASDLNDMYEGMRWNGAIFALLGPLMGFGIAAMAQYFPLATGLGLTRSEFARGTALVFLGLAAIFTIVVTIGKTIEQATTGWGLHIRFFDVFYTGVGPAWQTLIQTFLVISAFMFIGAAATTMVNRWGQFSLWVVLALFMVGGLCVVMGAILNTAFAEWLFSLLTMGWLPWMGVVLAIGVIGAAAWAILVRRAQAR